MARIQGTVSGNSQKPMKIQVVENGGDKVVGSPVLIPEDSAGTSFDLQFDDRREHVVLVKDE